MPRFIHVALRYARPISGVVVTALLLAGCDADPESNCQVASNAVARDGANGFSVRHESPERCPIGVSLSGNKPTYYSAEVKIIRGRQSDALELRFYDTQDAFIIGADFAWENDPNDGAKLRSMPAGNYTAARIPPRYGSRNRDIADNSVFLVDGQEALGTVFLPYETETIAIASSDAIVDQPFSASASLVGPEPTWPVSYEWLLDGVYAGSGSTFETFFHDITSRVLESVVTDAAGRVERRSVTIHPAYGGGCDLPPCEDR